MDLISMSDLWVFCNLQRLSQLRGIILTSETSHALSYLEKLYPTLANGTKVVVNFSGKGDKVVWLIVVAMKELIRENN